MFAVFFKSSMLKLNSFLMVLKSVIVKTPTVFWLTHRTTSGLKYLFLSTQTQVEFVPTSRCDVQM